MIFAQIVNESTEAVEVVAESLSVWDLAIKGGWIMVPLAALWVIAIYLFVERLLTINKANQDPDLFMGRVKDLVLKGDIPGAKMLCSQNQSPIARMIEKGVSRIGSPLKTLEASIENVEKIEVFKL
jgi:biopolymer transport protein ExbB